MSYICSIQSFISWHSSALFSSVSLQAVFRIASPFGVEAGSHTSYTWNWKVLACERPAFLLNEPMTSNQQRTLLCHPKRPYERVFMADESVDVQITSKYFVYTAKQCTIFFSLFLNNSRLMSVKDSNLSNEKWLCVISYCSNDNLSSTKIYFILTQS